MRNWWQRPAPRREYHSHGGGEPCHTPAYRLPWSPVWAGMTYSCEHSVYEPLWGVTLPVKAGAVEPEAAALRILYEVVVACVFARAAPPLGRDALRTLSFGYLMQHAAPAEMPRRSVGHDRQHVGRLGTLQQEQRARSRCSLSPCLFWHGERVRMRDGHIRSRWNLSLPLILTRSPFVQAGRGR